MTEWPSLSEEKTDSDEEEISVANRVCKKVPVNTTKSRSRQKKTKKSTKKRHQQEPIDEEGNTRSSDEEKTLNTWVCVLCDNHFKDHCCHVLECEFCENQYCRECLSMSSGVYNILN